MEQFFEILKYTIPGMIVFATAYHLTKQFLDEKQMAYLASQRAEAQKTSFPLRLQAYERYALLCDRISIPNLIMRVRGPEMKVRELKAALMIAIHHEFEHNASQQIYVSDVLWQILSVAKEETISLISRTAEKLDQNADSDLLVDALFEELQLSAQSPLQKALIAIRTEVSSLF